MKYIVNALSVLGIALLAGCSTTDKEIKADIAIKAKTEIGFTGVNYTVQNKVVTLTGICPSEPSRQKVLLAVKGIAVIDSIIDRISIAPIQLTADLPIKQQVDSVLSSYPRVTGSVMQSQVTLTGYASHKEADKLLPAINKLKPAAVNNQINLY